MYHFVLWFSALSVSPLSFFSNRLGILTNIDQSPKGHFHFHKTWFKRHLVVGTLIHNCWKEINWYWLKYHSHMIFFKCINKKSIKSFNLYLRLIILILWAASTGRSLASKGTPISGRFITLFRKFSTRTMVVFEFVL